MSIWDGEGPFRCDELADAIRTSTRWVQERVADGTIKAGRVGRIVRIPAREARRIARDLGCEPPERPEMQILARRASGASRDEESIAPTTVRAAS